MPTEKPVKRPYRSDVREQQARERRLAVIAAAGRLFAERGYGATSVDVIAAEAGVARATVFAAVGGKPALMRAAYELAVAGGNEEIPKARETWFAQLAAARSGAGVLRAYAAVLAEVYERLAPVYESLRIAAGTDAELVELLDEIDQARLAGAANIVAAVRRHGGLRPGLSAGDAADSLWAVGDPGLFHRLVVARQWDVARYRTWLAGVLCRELLGGDA
ncbi:TetR/AcrR family transcriptional regulator [Amycolatopsis sp. GM8]|uniref:TetR/AcrR family transcriptional regulator n=1 Tax=Amycolatopsis sp. GM8 TaxID=2896530 RepID=UPI001F1AC5A0|nr:TetR/AcrR family transcriptional regulator [Amycolatopsis sp. GM8]